MPKKTRNTRDLSGLSPLRTESAAEVAKLVAAITEDVGAIDFCEKTLVDDAAYYTWQKMLLRRIIKGIIEKALPAAMTRVLCQVLFPGNTSDWELALENSKASRSLADLWLLNDPEGRARVSGLLEEAGLDESAFEAEAFVIAAEELEQANKMLSSANREFERTIATLAKYRKKLAIHVRRNADRVLTADDQPSTINAALN